MATKLSEVQTAMRAGDWTMAIRIAARFKDLGKERGEILDAHGALTNPRFCAQLGKDPQALVEAGKAALVARYGYGEPSTAA